jgi:alkanesulfonate monooxygenase SsuD/methylene tetrahydromethanopterin reductase-like flavin-dependent oxidoreductase (luciferase family)
MITWEGGRHTPRIGNRGVYPRPLQDKLPVWIAVGGTPESVVRTAEYGLPLALAIIGGMPGRFVTLTNLYRQALKASGHDAENAGLAIHSHGYISDDSQKAADEYYGPYALLMGRIGKERGWPPMDRRQYEALREPEGALLVGSPRQVIDKILYEHELFANTRFLLHISVGTMPHASVMRAIELLGTEVAPAVKKAVGKI